MGFFLNSQSTPLTNRSFIKFIFNWRKIALQCCIGFCHTITQIILLIHIFPPSPHSSRSSQSTRLRFLCYIVTSHQLSILHMLVYMSVLLCQFILKHSPTTCKAHLSPYLFCRRRRNGAPDGLRSHKDQAQGHSPFTDSKHIAFCILQ